MSRHRPVHLLIVDDEALFLETMESIFRREGMQVHTSTSPSQALEWLGHNTADVALVDIVMPEMNGLEFLQRAKQIEHAPEVVMLTAHGTIDTAVDAMRRGAYDYLQKPASVSDVERIVRRASEKRRLRRENADLRRQLGQHDPYRDLIGSSTAMGDVRQMIERVAPTDSTVLILGESGVGKELVARKIHAASTRTGGPFLAVNCGSLRASLLENELFGHVAGAFTGATKTTRGLFEEADGGTLLIDEIGEMDVAVQAALLRVLEAGEVKRLGEARVRKTDVRIIASTNRKLEREVEQGNFRSDLYYRLNVVTLEIPPLRERREDIPELVDYLLDRLQGERPVARTVTRRALERLSAHDWPGNVRELKNALERGTIMARGEKIDVDDLPPLTRGQAAASSAPPSFEGEWATLAQLEKRQIERALARAEGNKTAAAKLLGISLRSLYTRLQKHGIESG